MRGFLRVLYLSFLHEGASLEARLGAALLIEFGFLHLHCLDGTFDDCNDA